MKIAISNIAWDTAEDEAVAELLGRQRVKFIDVAPGKYFPDPSRATDSEISKVKAWWLGRGFKITGMQALLFGTSGLNVFGNSQSQDAMLKHLDHICRIGAGLGGERLVFGSPKNRDRSGKRDSETMEIATVFFTRLGDIAAKHGVIICLEPNPTHYGANFMTTADETAAVVNTINHRAIKMQFDTGALTINNEDPLETLRKYAPLIGHIHISEPDLLPIGDGRTDHQKIKSALKHYLPDQLITIEMVASKNESHLTAIDRAVNMVNNIYHAEI